ncbi:MAG: OmpA family protein [Aureispira sp.]|nr:OmpA family protein [Aureispira sp.]
MLKRLPYLFLSTITLFLIRAQSNAQVLQNLVKNPSFEQYKKVPGDLGEVANSTYWTSPTKASPDYFHRRAAGPNVDIPTNKMGETKARSGYGYAGIYAYASRYNKRNFREYVQVQLKQPMRAGEKYCIKAHILLAHSSNRAVGALGITGSRIPLREDHEQPIDKTFTYLLKEDKGPLTDRNWVEVSCTYKATGGEQYLIVGNFNDDRSTKVTGAVAIEKFKNPHVDFAYYYVDDICATSLKSNFACDCGTFDYIATMRQERIVVDMKVSKKSYSVGQTVIMKGVEFEKNKATFLTGSNKGLDDLVGTLKMHPSYVIEISGHTHDRGGSPQKNQELSKRRAEAVQNYLIASGIAQTRLSHRGFGQSRPVALNDTAEGRARNERVQFKLLKK